MLMSFSCSFELATGCFCLVLSLMLFPCTVALRISLHGFREWLVPKLPGYCYTHAVVKGYRYRAALAYGMNPLWSDFSSFPHLEVNRRYKYYHLGPDGWTVHLYPDENGRTLSELDLAGLRCGTTFW